MSLVLPFDHWPLADRDMWNALMTSGSPLDEGGRLAHLRDTSQETLRSHYGRWLAWLQTTEPQVLAEAPVLRGTLERLMRWRDTLAAVRPMSRLSFIGDTLRVLMAAAPDRDWTVARRLKAQLKREAGRGDPARKAGRVLSTDVLLSLGIRHATVDADTATTKLEAMKRRRDGTMVAMLALMPIRRRAYVRLTIGTSLLVDDERLIVALPGELTKNSLPWEAEVPRQIAPLLRDYKSKVRPWLMARANERHAILWVDNRGAPFRDHYFGIRIAEITTRLTGVRVPPHFFRDAAATTLSRMSPDAARLIRPVLAHASFGTAERHYIHAQTIDAGRDYARLVKELKRSAP